MEKKIGEVFEYNGVKLITIEDKNNSCKGCFFSGGTRCVAGDSEIFCSASCRDDNKNVIFKKVEDMESRTVELTLEKAKEFYKKGGEFRDLVLSAFTEEELTKVELPKTWEEFCSDFPTKNDEYFICSDSNFEPTSSSTRQAYTDRNVLPSQEAAKAHLALMQLHQLRDCYRQGWKPDWNTETYCICKRYNDKNTNDIIVVLYKHYHSFLSFQEKSIAEKFLKNFRGLIEQAGDLI